MKNVDTVSTGILIFARLDSRRLPGKALGNIVGRPMLGRVLDRVRRVAMKAEIVVATSDRTVDDEIAEFAESEGIKVFRGASDNVAARALTCMETLCFDRCVRVCGDSPFMDPVLIDQLLALHSQNGADLVTNVLVRSFPPGLSVEVVTLEAMQRVVRETSDPADLEHMTRYIYKQADDFRIVDVRVPSETYQGIRLVVDTPDDLERAEVLTLRLGSHPEKASLDDVVRHAREIGAHSTL